ncbi:MAG: TlpA family protein disulfide reductase [Clostridia bacterium]|nr:TlpA family protein disulfide reductase [Clostridia bacterium]
MKDKNRILKILMPTALVLALLATVCGLTACSTTAPEQNPPAAAPEQSSEAQVTEDGVYFNESFDRENMQTIRHTPYVIEGNGNVIYEKTNGLGVILTDELTQARMADDARVGLFISEQMIGATYATDAAVASLPTDAEYEAMPEAEQQAIFDQYNRQTIYLFGVMKIDTNNEKDVAFFDDMMEKYQHADMFYNDGIYTYYFAYSDDLSNFEVSEPESPVLTSYIDSLGTIRDSICLFTPQEREEPETSAASFEGTLSDFSTVLMTGESADATIFADYDVTMVNLWATWCSPCVAELPELQKLYAQLPENVNLVSICSDASSETELAQKMIDDLGLTFTTLMDSDSLNENFISHCSAFPTTVFVDSEGNLVGQIFVGVPNGDVVVEYSALIDTALQSVAE